MTVLPDLRGATADARRATRPRTTRPPRSLPRTRSLRRRTVLVLLVELLVAVVGGWRLVGALTHDPGTALEVDGVTYRVSHVEQVSGLTTEDLSGMSHGIQGLVTDGEALVRVRIIITAPAPAPASSANANANGAAAGVAYDPSRLLAFAPDAGVGQPPVGGSVASGHLAPGASIEGLLSYVLPRSGQDITLGVAGGQRIPLIHVDIAPGGAQAPAHDHGGAAVMPMDPSIPDELPATTAPSGSALDPAPPSSLASASTP